MKGGVAKTTTAVNMAYLISQAGQNVLLIDNDIQGNASAFYECRKEAGMLTIADVFRGADMRAAVRRTKYDRLRVVAGDMVINNGEMGRVNAEARENTAKAGE
jgi:chromosome partitioning protein